MYEAPRRGYTMYTGMLGKLLALKLSLRSEGLALELCPYFILQVTGHFLKFEQTSIVWERH